jgi:threonine/homoserine/homoserine lactone efflux protein
MTNLILKGFFIGFVIAVPIGPIGILCVRRAISQSPAIGLFSGLGASTADLLYSWVAIFGLALISDFLVSQQFYLKLISGVAFGYLGIKIFVAKPFVGIVTPSKKGFFDAYTSAFLLTLANPSSILIFAVLAAGVGINAIESYLEQAVLITGIFIGSAFWALLISGSAKLVIKKINQKLLVWASRISGTVIFMYGLAEMSKLSLELIRSK